MPYEFLTPPEVEFALTRAEYEDRVAACLKHKLRRSKDLPEYFFCNHCGLSVPAYLLPFRGAHLD